MQTADNDFTKATGIEAIAVIGQLKCLVVKKLQYKSIPIQRLAYAIYHYPESKGNNAIKVTSTCGVANCVLKDHLRAIYKPTKKDIEYIHDNMGSPGIEFLSHVMKVSLPMLKDWWESQ